MDDYSEMIEAIRQNNIKKEEERLRFLDEHRQKAFNIAIKVSEMLKRDYGAKKVMLFGSLAAGKFHERSDIDIYVEGFTGNYWKAWLEAEEIGGGIEISIICSENALETLKNRVLKEGVEL